MKRFYDSSSDRILFIIEHDGFFVAYFRLRHGKNLSERSREGPIPDTLVEKTNTWRGGAIGAPLGSPIEGKIKEISTQASREAAREGRPVAYLSLDGFQRVETYPVGKGESTKCRLVREQIFQEGKLIRDEIKEFCQ